MEVNIGVENLKEVPNSPGTVYKLTSENLKRLGSISVPKRRTNLETNELGWSTFNDKVAVLKAIELLLSKSKRIETEAEITNEKRINPLVSSIHNRSEYLASLKNKHASLAKSIEDEKKLLEDMKNERTKVINEYKKSLSNLDARIKEARQYD